MLSMGIIGLSKNDSETLYSSFHSVAFSDDWRVRFAAVEKATVIFRFLDDKPVKKR